MLRWYSGRSSFFQRYTRIQAIVWVQFGPWISVHGPFVSVRPQMDCRSQKLKFLPPIIRRDRTRLLLTQILEKECLFRLAPQSRNQTRNSRFAARDQQSAFSAALS